MSSKSIVDNHLRLLPALILVVVVSTGLGAGYYFATASSGPSVQWSAFPLKIVIGPNGSGSGSDSFTCSSTISAVTLSVTNNHPDLVTSSVAPNSFASCGSTPDNIIVTLTCTAGVPVDQCKAVDNPAALVTVCGPTSYTCLSTSLEINSAKG